MRNVYEGETQLELNLETVPCGRPKFKLNKLTCALISYARKR